MNMSFLDLYEEEKEIFESIVTAAKLMGYKITIRDENEKIFIHIRKIGSKIQVQIVRSLSIKHIAYIGAQHFLEKKDVNTWISYRKNEYVDHLKIILEWL